MSPDYAKMRSLVIRSFATARQWLGKNRIFFDTFVPILLIIVTYGQYKIYQEQTRLIAIQSELANLQLTNKPRLELSVRTTDGDSITWKEIRIVNDGAGLAHLKLDLVYFLEVTMVIGDFAFMSPFVIEPEHLNTIISGRSTGEVASLTDEGYLKISQLLSECKRLPNVKDTFFDIHAYVASSFRDLLGRPYDKYYRISQFDKDYLQSKPHLTGLIPVFIGGSIRTLPVFQFDFKWDRLSFKTVELEPDVGKYAFKLRDAAGEAAGAIKPEALTADVMFSRVTARFRMVLPSVMEQGLP